MRLVGDFRVSALELFLDVVFVLTVAQLSDHLHEDLRPGEIARAALILALVWWMYAGYAWLTNAIPPNSTGSRTLLLAGMAGFLLMAVAVPEAFGEDGRLFGVGYSVVAVVHAALFRVEAMRTVTLLNLAAAVPVLAGGFLSGPWRPLCWLAALPLHLLAGFSRRARPHSIAPGHFAERHGVIVIVALGESVVAVGLGLTGTHPGPGEIGAALLGLAIAYYLWWCYFSGSDERVRRELSDAAPGRQARLALTGYGFAHLPLLFGIVLVAAGLHRAVGHPFEPLPRADAGALAVGAALFLAGHGVLLRVFRLPGAPYRFGAAVLVTATAALGPLTAIAQLVALPVVMAAMAMAEDLPRARRAGHTGIDALGG
ncbi:low temperature requirement protein A [Streptomyces sp. NPDC047000]|uniref:low temperature requirement protein A n=1 Tax=Streptomyces sp. NPDC047000 TaxID=3155474 RepID=UPI0034043E96